MELVRAEDLAGNGVGAENYQHAEHYFRTMNAGQEATKETSLLGPFERDAGELECWLQGFKPSLDLAGYEETPLREKVVVTL
jgi:hypothetical protein